MEIPSYESTFESTKVSCYHTIKYTYVYLRSCILRRYFRIYFRKYSIFVRKYESTKVLSYNNVVRVRVQLYTYMYVGISYIFVS